MAKKHLDTTITCACGGKEFEPLAFGRNAVGRPEFRITCRQCGAIVEVGKTTYSLYRYLASAQPSVPFLKLFDLE
jgi:hypothetical protein